MKYYRIVKSTLNQNEIIKRLARFDNVTEWDKSVKSSIVDKSTLDDEGDPKVGTKYTLTVDFLGSDVIIDYMITELTATTLTLVGTNENSITTDVMVTRPSTGPEGGNELVYTANIDIRFPYNLCDCIMKCLFNSTVEMAIDGLRIFLNDPTGQPSASTSWK